MPWAPDEWQTFCGLVEHGWPGEFDATARAAWRAMLDAHDPQAVVGALKRLIAKGGTFRPSISELVAEVHADPSAPSFGEMLQALYEHPHGALFAPDTQAALERALAVHALVAAFVRSMTIRRLREINLADPDYGHARRAQLRAEWEDFCQRAHQRQAHAIAAGQDPRRGLERFDPLAALGAKQIGAGDD